MGFAASYLQRHSCFEPFIPRSPADNTSLIVVIPCFNEPSILDSLNSLYNANRPSFAVEVIVAVNSPEGAAKEIIEQNRLTLVQVRQWSSQHSCSNFTVHAIDVPPFPARHAGAGFARKTGMDEAVYRFNLLDNDRGIIVSFDADSLCDTNYFTELEKCFSDHRTTGCNVYFEHPLPCSEKTPVMYRAVVQYELYLRYFVQALRFAGFPWAFHTIGSCFAVNSGVYAKQGGMNRKKAGEDFYFLNKVFPLGHFTELNTTRVIPSSRISDRVPFGTGAAIKRLTGEHQGGLLTWPPESFDELSAVFTALPDFYGATVTETGRISGRFSSLMQEYLYINGFTEAVVQANTHSAGLLTFKKRFFAWFNALRLLQFLNFARNRGRKSLHVTEAAALLLQRNGISPATDESGLLTRYRAIQRESEWKC